VLPILVSTVPVLRVLLAPPAEVLSLLATHKLHRLYVVNETVEPIGLITLTDVLKLLCNEVRDLKSFELRLGMDASDYLHCF
jgi:CBS domain-containing protein